MGKQATAPGRSGRGFGIATFLLVPVVLVALAGDARTAPPVADASVLPREQPLNNGAVVFNFKITNTGSQGIGAVRIGRPSRIWRVVTCPMAPPGWTAQRRSADVCWYLSGPGSGDDIQPGETSTAFQVVTATTSATANRAGVWSVRVSRTSKIRNLLLASPAYTGALNTTAYSFQITDAILADGPLPPGSPCPPTNHLGNAGQTRTVVICGRNGTSRKLTPVASASSLGGSLFAAAGSFSSGSIAKLTGAPVVLGNWTGAVLTSSAGTGKTVVAVLGASSTHTSEPTTFNDFEARGPRAVDDTYSGFEDSASIVGPPGVGGNDVKVNPAGTLASSLVSSPASGSLVGGLHSDGSFTYQPGPDNCGTSTFTYKVVENAVESNVATVTLNITCVNDPPSFARGPDQTVDEDAGAQLVPWATGISPGPGPSEAGQGVGFIVGAATDPGLFAVQPAISPGGVLSYTPAADASGSALVVVVMADTGGTGNGGVNVGAPVLFTITVNAVNDAPVFTKGPDQSFLEDSGSHTAANWATGLQAGPAEETGQGLHFEVSDNSNPGLFSVPPAVSPAGALTWATGPDAFGSADIEIDLKDDGGTGNGGADTSASQTVRISATAVNDAPSFTKGPDQLVAKNAPAQTVPGWATAVSPGPANEASQTLTFQLTNNNPGLFSAAPAVSPTGTLTFTPATGASGTATLGVVLNDDGGTAAGGVDASPSRSLTITVNDPPVAGDDSYPTQATEDLPFTAPAAVGVLPNDNDPDAGPSPLAATLLNGPANGSLGAGGLAADGSFTYTPIPNFCGTDLFTYRVSDGVSDSNTATVTLEVRCVNDAPSFTKGADQTVDEDAGPQSVNPWATAISAGPANESTQTLSFDVTGNTNAGLFSSGPAVAPDGALTYTSTANANGNANITLTLADSGGTAGGGADTSADQTFTITVGPVNDAPLFTAGPDQTVNEDSVPNTVPGWATGIGAGPADESGQTVSFAVTGNANPSLFSVAPSVDAATGTLTFTPAADAFGTATITLALSDNGGTANAGADTTTKSFGITVQPVDDAPVATGDTYTVPEDGVLAPLPAGVLGNDADIDSAALTASLVTGPAHGTLTLNADGSFTYTPAPDYNGPDSFAYKANDGAADSNSATVSITVGPVNDAPVAAADAYSTDEDTALNVSAPGVLANDTDIDPDAMTAVKVGDPAHGTVTVNPDGSFTYTPNANYSGADSFTYKANDGSADSTDATVAITVVPANLPPSATDDSYPASEDTLLTVTAPGVLGNDTDPDADLLTAVLISGPSHAASFTLDPDGSFAYSPTANDNGPDSFTYKANDGALDSGTATVALTVNAVNDAPVAVIDTGTTDEDTPLNVAMPGVLANDTDPDAVDTKTVVQLNGSVTLTGTSLEGAVVTINANGSYTYNPGSVFQGLSTGQSDTDSFTYTMADGAAVQSTATVNLTITGVSDSPVAVADSFDAIGNTGLFVGTTRPAGEAGRQITGSVLANDTDPDTPQASLVAEPVVNASTTLGGTITIESDGNFTYQPDDGDTGVTDTFTYRVCDASPCNSGTVANATGTLSLPIAGQVWYVRNNAAPGGLGTSAGPFDTIGEAETASSTGDTVYIFDGDNTSTNLNTGYLMEANERLIGENSGLSLDPDGPGALPLVNLHAGNAGAYPTLTTNAAEDVVSLASGSTVDGFNIDPVGTGGGIGGGTGAGGPAAGNVTIANVNVVDTGTAGTQAGLDLDGTTGTNNISNLVVSNGGSAAAIGVRLNNAGTVNFQSAGTISITTDAAKGLDATGTNMGAGSVFDEITVTGSGSGAVSMLNTTGTTSLGDGSGTDLSLTTSSGAPAAFLLNNAGSVTVDAGGTDTLSATGGPALDVTATPGATLAFDGVSSTNSAGDGINIAGLGSGTFAANATSAISNAAGIDFDLDGGSGGITYDGPISDDVGQLVRVNNTSGGTKDFNGTITDGGDGDGSGVSLASNTGATIRFDGGLTLSTGANPALSATGGGTLAITDPAGATVNTIATTTATALNVADTTIHSDGVTFQSIVAGTVASGPANGIILNNTGSAAGLTVTGTGSAGSGGTIQNIGTRGASFVGARNISLNHMVFTNANLSNGAVSDGILGSNSDENGAIHLETATNVALADVTVTTAAQHGINGNGVTNLDLTNVTISGTGNAVWESGIFISNLTGRASANQDNVFQNLNVSNTGQFNVWIQNGTPTAAAPAEKDKLSIINSTFSNSGQSVIGDHVSVINGGTANFQTVVSGTSFTANLACGGGTCTSDNIQVDASNSATSDASISTSTFSNAGQSAINLSGSGSGKATFSVANNAGVGVRAGTGINLASNGSSDLSGTISGNTISTSVTNNPAFGIQMLVDAAGGSIVANVHDNVIGGNGSTDFEYGIRGGARTSNGTVDLTLNNNTIQSAKTAGVWLFSGNGTPSETSRTCVNFVSNTIDAGGAVPFVDYFVEMYTGTTFQIQGLTGSGTSATGVQAFIAGTDDDPSPTDPTVDAGSGTVTNYTNATCATAP